MAKTGTDSFPILPAFLLVTNIHQLCKSYMQTTKMENPEGQIKQFAFIPTSQHRAYYIWCRCLENVCKLLRISDYRIQTIMFRNIFTSQWKTALYGIPGMFFFKKTSLTFLTMDLVIYLLDLSPTTIKPYNFRSEAPIFYVFLIDIYI